MKDKSIQKTPKHLEYDQGLFISLQSITTVLIPFVGIGITNNWVYKLVYNNIEKTKYKIFFDFYSIEYQITAKTIDLSENHFDLYFEELCKLGFGGFGTVLKVKNIYTQRETAVKKIQLKGNTISKNIFNKFI